MEKYQRIMEKANEKYAFLRVLAISYEKNKHCAITLMYPEQSVFEPADEDRIALQEILAKELSLSVPIQVKFKKSFLDDELILQEIEKYFQENHATASAFLDMDECNLEKGERITITIPLDETAYQKLHRQNAEDKLAKALASKFYGDFRVVFQQKFIEIDDSILEKMWEEALAEIASVARVPRYQVEIMGKLFGKDIPNQPEFIGNNSAAKRSVILAGIVENISVKEFVSKRKKDEGKTRYLYKFILRDDSGYAECLTFCNEKSKKFLANVENGMRLLVMGNLNLWDEKLSLTVLSASLCCNPTKPEETEFKSETVICRTYHTIIPQPYDESSQANLFDVQPAYKSGFLEKEYVIYDLETTGLSPAHDEIIEIGGVRIKQGRIVETFCSLIKPSIRIPSSATAVNKITDEMVSGAPLLQDVLSDFLLFVGNSTLVGYNNTSFDDFFLKNAIQKCKVDCNFPFSLDCLPLARNYLPSLKKHNLSAVSAAFSIKHEEAHRSLGDCLATARLFIKLSEI